MKKNPYVGRFVKDFFMKKNPYVGRFVCFFSVHKISYGYNSLTNDHMNMKFGMMKEHDCPQVQKKYESDIFNNQVTVTY